MSNHWSITFQVGMIGSNLHFLYKGFRTTINGFRKQTENVQCQTKILRPLWFLSYLNAFIARDRENQDSGADAGVALGKHLAKIPSQLGPGIGRWWICKTFGEG